MPSSSVLPPMHSFALNRRIVSTVVVGCIIALATLLIVPIGEVFARGPHGESPFAHRGHRAHGGPPFHDHRKSGPSPDEFLRPYNERPPPRGNMPPPHATRVGDHSRAGRYGNNDNWKYELEPPEIDGLQPPTFRPFQPPVSSFAQTSDYLKQTLVADYAGPVTEKVFFMLKTGATVMWERLPMHVATTLTRVKNFAIYSDLASSISGYEVIDILKDLPQSVMEHEQLDMYRSLRELHGQGLGGEVSDLDFDNKGWDLDKFKNIPMLVHAYETSPESEWFIFMDDDTYLVWNNLEIALAAMDPRKPLYLGSLAYMEMKVNGGVVHNFAHGGSGVIISKGAMDLLFGPRAKRTGQELINYYSNITLEHCCGDMMVAYMLFEEIGLEISSGDPRWPWRRMQGEPTNAVRWRKDMWCEPLLSFHHASARELEHLWEYERLKQKGTYITHHDLYHDWMQPYIVEERPFWLLWEFDYDGHHQFEPDDLIVEDNNSTFSPVESPGNCRRACQKDDLCMAWYHVDTFCGLHRRLFRPGVPSTPLHVNWPGSTPTTGWMVDRIRNWRKKAKCDGLKDDEQFSEGWFVRAEESTKAKTASRQNV